MPDREYALLQNVPIGVVSESQNTVTLIGSFGFIGASIFLAVYMIRSAIIKQLS
jgi:hypothetical protein